MNSDSENFDSLRRLLALKRHEQPPPGYFNRFSRDVMSRIKAGENGGEMAPETSWIERLAAKFVLKPVFAGAFGTAVCALLISGVITVDHVAANGSVAPGARENSSLAVASTANAPAIAVNTAFEPSSTNPVTPPSLFDQFQVPAAQNALFSYRVPGGN